MEEGKCTFCQIIDGEIKAQVVHETPEVMVIKDKKPRAPVHLLIIPKTHVPSVNEVNEILAQKMGFCSWQLKRLPINIAFLPMDISSWSM